MDKKSAPGSETQHVIGEGFSHTAFVVVAPANCLYQPDPHAAVRVIPPYGTEVQIIRDDGDWVLIEYCSKEAWSPRHNLSSTLMPEREAVDVGITPAPNFHFQSQRVERSPFMDVEYGPRGGRFVRTSAGFRRYF